MRGQAEIVVIVGVIVVALVVIATQMDLSSLGGGGPPDVRLARESVEGMITAGLYDTVDRMSTYGGYLSASEIATDYVMLDGKAVPYWQKDGVIRYPDPETTMMEGLDRYIRENKASLAAGLNSVVLGEARVGRPDIYSDRITVKVQLPTNVRDVSSTEPYTVTILTRFGDMYDFAESFAAFNTEQRMLEYYTLSSMRLSPTTSGVDDILSFESLTGCGDLIIKGWRELKESVEESIGKTLASIYLPGDVPLNTLSDTESSKYTLTPLGGRVFNEIGIGFTLPDGFALSRGTFGYEEEPIKLVSEVVHFTGECVSDPLSVDYFIDYPAVVVLNDPVTGNDMRFALQVYIKDSLPGMWPVSGYEPDERNLACRTEGCSIDIAVQDTGGYALEGADILFMGCPIGKTDSSGTLSAYAPCGIGGLEVFKKGYSPFNETSDSQGLVRTVSLQRMPEVNLVFNELVFEDHGVDVYLLDSSNVRYNDDNLVYMDWVSLATGGSREVYSEEGRYILKYMPAGEYSVAAAMYNTTIKGISGAFGTRFVLTEAIAGKTIYVTIPVMTGFARPIDYSTPYDLVGKMVAIMEECGIEPISESPPYVSNCIVDVNELRGVTG